MKTRVKIFFYLFLDKGEWAGIKKQTKKKKTQT